MGNFMEAQKAHAELVDNLPQTFLRINNPHNKTQFWQRFFALTVPEMIIFQCFLFPLIPILFLNYFITN